MGNRLIFAAVILNLAFLIVLNAFHATAYYKSTLKAEKEKALVLATTIAHSLDLPMNEGEMAVVQEMLQNIVRLSSTKIINLTDDTGLIRFSSDPWKINSRIVSVFTERALKENIIAEGVERQGQATLYSLALPIMNEHRCYSCHGDKKNILGVLRIGVDWDSVQATLKDSYKRDAAVSIVFYIVLISLALLFRRLYVRAQKANIVLRHTQEQLIKSEKMAAIGQMAAAISHDLRNPLTGIKMAAYYLGTKLNDTQPEAVNILKDIELEIDYASNVVTNILFYSRPTELIYTCVDIHKILEDALRFIRIQNKVGNIDIVTDYGTDIPDVLIDAKLIKQVVMNLFSNAVQSMSSAGGALTVRTRAENKNLVITIADTGCGIEQKNLDRIFTPFFTTRARGVGLGLAIVHTIIHKHGGSITVDSVVGTGTTFMITLPVRTDISEVKNGRDQHKIG